VADFVHHRDVRMTQRRCRARLSEQPGRALAAVRAGPDGLQRDDAAEAQVLGSIHVAHPAGSQALENPIVVDGGTGQHEGSFADLHALYFRP